MGRVMFCMCGGLWYASNFFSFTEEDMAMPHKAKKRRIARARRLAWEHACSLPDNSCCQHLQQQFSL